MQSNGKQMIEKNDKKGITKSAWSTFSVLISLRMGCKDQGPYIEWYQYMPTPKLPDIIVQVFFY